MTRSRALVLSGATLLAVLSSPVLAQSLRSGIQCVPDVPNVSMYHNCRLQVVAGEEVCRCAIRPQALRPMDRIRNQDQDNVVTGSINRAPVVRGGQSGVGGGSIGNGNTTGGSVVGGGSTSGGTTGRGNGGTVADGGNVGGGTGTGGSGTVGGGTVGDTPDTDDGSTGGNTGGNNAGGNGQGNGNAHGHDNDHGGGHGNNGYGNGGGDGSPNGKDDTDR